MTQKNKKNEIPEAVMASLDDNLRYFLKLKLDSKVKQYKFV